MVAEPTDGPPLRLEYDLLIDATGPRIDVEATRRGEQKPLVIGTCTC